MKRIMLWILLAIILALALPSVASAVIAPSYFMYSLDPVGTPSSLEPGSVSLNFDYGFPNYLGVQGEWTISEHWGIKAFVHDPLDYQFLGVDGFGRFGPITAQIGIRDDMGYTSVTTGLSGFFPCQEKRSGFGFAVGSEITAMGMMGFLEAGWRWNFGERSSFALGLAEMYRWDTGGVDFFAPSIVADLQFDERVGRFLFNGKLDGSLSYFGLGPLFFACDGSASVDYMFSDSFGAGVFTELSATAGGINYFGWGLDIALRF